MKPNKLGGQDFSKRDDLPVIIPLMSEATYDAASNGEYLGIQTGCNVPKVPYERRMHLRLVKQGLSKVFDGKLFRRQFHANAFETQQIIGVLRWATSPDTTLRPNVIQPSALDYARDLVAQFDEVPAPLSMEEIQDLKNPNDLR